jgi:hypothetical protein
VTKKLTLKPREISGRRVWHDAVLVANALETVAKGQPLTKAAVWMGTARKIELEKPDEEPLPAYDVVLRNKEARMLWREMLKLPPEAFGRHPATGQPHVVNLFLLDEMLRDFAEQLGEELPVEFDEDEEG